MDFDLERNLEDAGIDAFDFSLMNDDERREVLNDAGLDPNDYEDIEFEESFSAWSALQDSGTNLWELNLMDDDEKENLMRTLVSLRKITVKHIRVSQPKTMR